LLLCPGAGRAGDGRSRGHRAGAGPLPRLGAVVRGRGSSARVAGGDHPPGHPDEPAAAGAWPGQERAVRRDVTILAVCTFLAWALVAYPAWKLGEEAHAVYAGVAALLCLVPTAVNLVWARWAFHQPPELRLVMVLGGTGLRMFFVLLAGTGLYLGL